MANRRRRTPSHLTLSQFLREKNPKESVVIDGTELTLFYRSRGLSAPAVERLTKAALGEDRKVSEHTLGAMANNPAYHAELATVVKLCLGLSLIRPDPMSPDDILALILVDEVDEQRVKKPHSVSGRSDLSAYFDSLIFEPPGGYPDEAGKAVLSSPARYAGMYWVLSRFEYVVVRAKLPRKMRKTFELSRIPGVIYLPEQHSQYPKQLRTPLAREFSAIMEQFEKQDPPPIGESACLVIRPEQDLIPTQYEQLAARLSAFYDASPWLPTLSEPLEEIEALQCMSKSILLEAALLMEIASRTKKSRRSLYAGRALELLRLYVSYDLPTYPPEFQAFTYYVTQEAILNSPPDKNLRQALLSLAKIQFGGCHVLRASGRHLDGLGSDLFQGLRERFAQTVATYRGLRGH